MTKTELLNLLRGAFENGDIEIKTSIQPHPKYKKLIDVDTSVMIGGLIVAESTESADIQFILEKI